MASLRAGHEPALGEIGRRFLATFDSTTSLRPGRVTLVGAGPGGADLITVRGAAALAAADIVVYDRLVDSALLDLAPVAAKRIPVGKAEGHGTGQTRIKDLLIEHARAGAHVVRLKGGDPFLFGPGREELEAVRGERICVEVVPGLTSALAGPALAATTGTDAAANLIANGRPADEPVAAV